MICALGYDIKEEVRVHPVHLAIHHQIEGAGKTSYNNYLHVSLMYIPCRPPPKSPHSKNEKMKSGGGMKIVPIKPETLDASVRFNSIGGLDSHIQCLKEMILLPMMYPEVFRQFQIKPPRGVLFHGPPGIILFFY